MPNCTVLYSSTECFGLHIGNPQSANLGDGNGWVNQTVSFSVSQSAMSISMNLPRYCFMPCSILFCFQVEIRQDYDDSLVGTCIESLIGGNHFRCVGVMVLGLEDSCMLLMVLRVYRQNGSHADSGALFLACVNLVLMV